MNEYPVPQANNIELLFELYCTFPDGGLTALEVATAYGMAERQGSYYLSALAFLGLLRKEQDAYVMTHKGEFVRSLMQHESLRVQKKIFCISLFQLDLFVNVYSESMELYETDTKLGNVAAELNRRYQLSTSTAYRRAATLLAWCKWIEQVLGSECGQ